VVYLGGRTKVRNGLGTGARSVVIPKLMLIPTGYSGVRLAVIPKKVATPDNVAGPEACPLPENNKHSIL